MKTRLTLLASSIIALASLNALRAEDEPQAAVPVIIVSGNAQTEAPKAENQQLFGPSAASIIPAEQARVLIDKFKDAYAKLGNPRMLFFINRDLVDSSSGMKLNTHTEKYEEANSKTATSGENTYAIKESPKPTLADRQTAREVERLFGRAFRAAGASLADQKVAADMLSDKPHGNLSGLNDQAAKDREALGSISDVVVEILVSSRAVTVPSVSGDQQMLVPDIQATAIRLKDAAILGQAASSDILGKDRSAGRMLQQYDVRDVTEATALALMEDMATSAK